jgi:superfamily II DNA or RNA helicase
VRKGRAAIFLDTGNGKTFIQVEYARLMGQNTLIIAPLSVARQTVREGAKIGVEVRYVRSQAEVTGEHKLWITNYEMIDAFDMSQFGTAILDESGILKAISGKTRRKITERVSACRTV